MSRQESIARSSVDLLEAGNVLLTWGSGLPRRRQRATLSPRDVGQAAARAAPFPVWF